MIYGNPPADRGSFNLGPSDVVHTQYLPIGMPHSGIRIPENLEYIRPLVNRLPYSRDRYIYATVRNQYVTTGSVGNRPGWHADGFGTNDINLIWCDSNPTEFCIQEFNLSSDCDTSLREMEEQAKSENIRVYPVNTLLMLDEAVIHRVPIDVTPGFRRFVKLSVSTNKYNLVGNAHNYLFDYDWEMHPRKSTRNHPTVV